VLEHIPDDVGSLRALHRMLQPGGRLVLLVPALPAIYGTLDEALGHVRRYTAGELRKKYRQAGFRTVHQASTTAHAVRSRSFPPLRTRTPFMRTPSHQERERPRLVK
jgi:hypothetical protein